HTFAVPVSGLSTGLSLIPGNAPGLLDLLVGNEFGDILRLVGKGDGTFQPVVDDRVPFVTSDFNGDQIPDVFLANQKTNQALIHLRQPGTQPFTPGNFGQDSRNGLNGPGNVQLADLNGDNVPDRIIANSRSTNVLVYVSQADGGFKQASFFVGQNPLGM